MSYAIVGFGKIGQALAHAFARKNINVTVASRRPPEALAPQARAIGPTVVARSLQDALEADTIILAVPFGEHREVAKAMPSWKGNPSLPVLRHTPALSRTHVFPRGSVHSLLGDFRSDRASTYGPEGTRFAARIAGFRVCRTTTTTSARDL